MNTCKPGRRLLPSFLSAVLALSLASCSVIRIVQVDAPTWDCATSGQHFCNQTTVRTSIWKGSNNAKISASCSNGISRVKVTTRPGDVFLGFLTLGFVVRQRIEWDCAQRSGSTDM